MNEVHTLQRTDTAEGEGIAQGVIQRESQYVGRKKFTWWQCQRSRVSPNMGGFLGIETEFVEPFRLGRPSFIRPASLDNCGSHASIYLLKPFHRAQRCEDSFCTSVDIGFKTHFGASSLSA
jgi:hypothetical protein